MRNEIYGFEGLDKEVFYYKLIDEHSSNLLKGVLEYYKGYINLVNDDPNRLEGKDLDLLKELVNKLEEGVSIIDKFLV